MNWIVMSLRRSFEYSGRSHRREFWSFMLFAFVTLWLVGHIEDALGLGSTGTMQITADGVATDREGGMLSAVVLFALALPGLAVSVRRLHDTDRPGWWLALPAAPLLIWAAAILAQFTPQALFAITMIAFLLAPLVVLAFMCIPGHPGPNRFGANPKEADLARQVA